MTVKDERVMGEWNIQQAHKRMDEMGFTQEQQAVIFYDWPEGNDHIQWLLTASQEEITSWLESVGK